MLHTLVLIWRHRNQLVDRVFLAAERFQCQTRPLEIHLVNKIFFKNSNSKWNFVYRWQKKSLALVDHPVLKTKFRYGNYFSLNSQL